MIKIEYYVLPGCKYLEGSLLNKKYPTSRCTIGAQCSYESSSLFRPTSVNKKSIVNKLMVTFLKFNSCSFPKNQNKQFPSCSI